MWLLIEISHTLATLRKRASAEQTVRARSESFSGSAAIQRKACVSMSTFIGAAALISRISPSRIEGLFDFGWQRIVKILGNRELTPGPAEFAFRAGVAHGRQFGHWHIGAHDGNFLSLFDPFEETR